MKDIQEVKRSIVRPLPKVGRQFPFKYLAVGIVVVILGVATGWQLSGAGAIFNDKNLAPLPDKMSDKEAGVSDDSTFKDTAEGTIQKGALEGDGTHTLIREGGPTKHVALSSTIIDLDRFVGKKVQVWGQTLTAQKAPWLMDVGKLKSLE